MKSKESDIDYKLLRILIDNEIDLKILIEYFDRFSQNLLKFREKSEGTHLSMEKGISKNEFSKFVDQLKRIEAKSSNELTKFVKDGIEEDVKLELMLQNSEKLFWLLELEGNGRNNQPT